MIIHIDMDAFFASVEQMDDPALRGKPVIVGGEQRGVVSTCSYEARVFGVHSAMPMATARRLCPQAIVVRGRYSRYAELSQAIMAALGEFSPLVEQASVDEAYVDGTGLERLFGSLEELVARMKERVREATGGLTCSAGVAPVKFLAKICSDINKPDGLCVVRPEEAEAFMASMPVARIHGVGPVTARRMASLGIHKGEDLKAWPLPALQRHFGKAAAFYHGAARGIDERPVRDREVRKSISVEDTFETDIGAEDKLLAELEKVAGRLWQRVTAAQANGRTVTLKIKLGDFRILTRSRTLIAAPVSAEDLFAIGSDLLRAQLPLPIGARLLGLGLSNLVAPEGEDDDEEDGQLRLALG